MSLSDSRKMWKLAARPGGVHSHDCRRLGISGNPSQRAKDIADHVPFWTVRERRNGRPGSRYFADGFQPEGAVRVRPNGVELGDRVGAGPAVTDLSAEPNLRDWDGTWRHEPDYPVGRPA